MTIEDLKKQIKSGKFLKSYFFFGEETFLMDSRLKQIENKLIAPDFKAFNLFKLEGVDVSFDDVTECVMQFPQMSEKKLIEVRNAGWFNNASYSIFKQVRELVSDIPDYLCLIFIEEKFDAKKIKNLKFFEESGGGVLEFKQLSGAQIEIWLTDRAEKIGKMVLSKDMNYLARLCGFSLGKASSEFSKLVNYVGDRNKITREDINAIVQKSVDYRVYDILENIIECRRGAAWEQLEYLKQSRETPVRILGIMSGKISEMLMCKTLNEEGLSPEEMMGYFDFHRPAFAVKKTISESKRFGENFLIRMQQKGLEYDYKIKSGALDGWAAVEMYLAELLG